MSDSIEAEIGAVRRRQIFLLALGAIAALLPVVTRQSAFVATLLLGLSLTVLLPLSYWLFASAVERGAARLSGAPVQGQLATRHLALLTLLPVVGAFVEVVVLFRLARATARIEGAVDRSSLVLGLAGARVAWVWMLGPVIGLVLAFTNNTAFSWVLYCLAPLGSLALLGVLTQIIMTPLLEEVVPSGKGATLGAAGASSSMAVPSSRGAK